MIIARTPYRLSFFGGGTDYPAWYTRQGGAVLSTTIDKYCYVSVRHLPPFFSNKHRVVWSHVETVQSVSEILHPAVREGLRMMEFGDGHGLEIHHQGDLPARAGMGSSSSFAVGLLQALAAYRGQMIDKHELALRAVELEQARLHENVGTQDQFAAAYGGLNVIEFRQDGEIRVDPVTIPPDRIRELERHLLLFYTGTSRLSSDVAAEVVANLGQRREVLTRMRGMVDQAVSLLSSSECLDEFGRMLHETWSLKRKLSTRIASDTVEDVYRRAMRAGALGGKLLGAGSSGFMAFYVPEKRQEAVKRTLSNYLQVPFGFESEGSRVIYYGSQAPELESPMTDAESAPRTRRRSSAAARASL